MSEKGAHKQIQEEEALGRDHCQRWAEYILVRKVLHPMGDPHWSRDTQKGLQPVENLGRRRANKQKGREKENSKK